jgi:predicted nucleotide-binding protein (sugar kinase/HSP70/actin superfamily)
VIGLTHAATGEKNPGLEITVPMLRAGFMSIIFGDVIMQCLYRTRPYEAEPGSADALYEKWMDRARKAAPTMNRKTLTELTRGCVADFDALPLFEDRSKPRVGVVGEILVKFHPTANNQLVKVIEGEGCEANVPGLMDFFLYSLAGPEAMQHELGSKAIARATHKIAINYVQGLREPLNKMLAASQRFDPYPDLKELAAKAQEVLSLCNTMGEGWLLTAEMVDLIESGTPNIVCAQPFACLPNHVVGKSVIKRLRQMHPESNIVAVDYDPGASEVNQLNRIKLMISVAKENFRQNREEGFRLRNPEDPTEKVVAPYVEESYWSRREANNDYGSDFDTGAPIGSGSPASGGLRLSDEQKRQLEEIKAKHRS